MSVKIDFDASTNVLAIGLPADSTGDEYYDTFTAIQIMLVLVKRETSILPLLAILVATAT